MATVYGVSASPFVRKLRVFLDEKGIDYETKPVFPGTDDESFRAISPLGKVPAYRDEEVAISDSSVICAYLEKKHPEPPLYPTAGADYARALWFEEYADTAVVEPAVAVFLLDDYVSAGIMCAAEADRLRSGVAERLNILVAGGTGTGKTTLTNALLAEVAKTTDRVVLIEDTRELQCRAGHISDLHTGGVRHRRAFEPASECPSASRESIESGACLS